MFNIKPLDEHTNPYTGVTSQLEPNNKMKTEYYPQTSTQVLDVKKAFKLTEKTEIVLTEYIVKINDYLLNIDLERKLDKIGEVERKANELNHTMNMKKMDID